MLSMLEIAEKRERGFFGRIWDEIFRPSVDGKMETVGSIPYIRITSEEKRRGHDWRMIEAHALDCSGRILMPRGVDCPDESELRRFVPIVFMRRMLENFAVEILSQISVSPSRRKMALYGLDAEIIALIPRLIPIIGELRIITRRAYAVKDVADQVTQQTGMPITITDDPNVFGCNLLLAPAGGGAYLQTDGDTIFLSPDRPSSDVLLWIRKAQVEVPPLLEGAYRDCYDECEFVGAFYELAGMRDLAKLIPSAGISGKESFTAQRAASLLSGR